MLRCVGHCRLIKPGCHVDDPRDELLGSFRHSSFSISHLISTLVDPTRVGLEMKELILMLRWDVMHLVVLRCIDGTALTSPVNTNIPPT